MFPTDKEVAKLIKKIQKKVSDDAQAKERTRKPQQKENTIVEDTSSEIFNEMKKLPFTS